MNITLYFLKIENFVAMILHRKSMSRYQDYTCIGMAVNFYLEIRYRKIH